MKAINSGDEAERNLGAPEGMSLGMSRFCLSLCPACPSVQCPGQVTGRPCREPVDTRYCFGHHHPLQGSCCPCAHCPVSTGKPCGKITAAESPGLRFEPWGVKSGGMMCPMGPGLC